MCFTAISAAIAPLELKLRVRRYEGVRPPLSTAEQPVRPAYARRDVRTALHARFQDLRRRPQKGPRSISGPHKAR